LINLYTVAYRRVDSVHSRWHLVAGENQRSLKLWLPLQRFKRHRRKF